jgi:hypothetical protein
MCRWWHRGAGPFNRGGSALPPSCPTLAIPDQQTLPGEVRPLVGRRCGRDADARCWSRGRACPTGLIRLRQRSPFDPRGATHPDGPHEQPRAVESVYRFGDRTSIGIFEPPVDLHTHTKMIPSRPAAKRFEAAAHHERTRAIAVSSLMAAEFENSSRIAAATSATGHVSHHGWLLVMRGFNRGATRTTDAPNSAPPGFAVTWFRVRVWTAKAVEPTAT